MDVEERLTRPQLFRSQTWRATFEVLRWLAPRARCVTIQRRLYSRLHQGRHTNRDEPFECLYQQSAESLGPKTITLVLPLPMRVSPSNRLCENHDNPMLCGHSCGHTLTQLNVDQNVDQAMPKHAHQKLVNILY